jgi:L-ribulose-5-phosphate 3-epimerase
MNPPMIGLMQGRLSKRDADKGYQHFPTEWDKEFPVAQAMGFDCIELIFDEWSLGCFMNIESLMRFHSAAFASRLKLTSVCGDYFMQNKLTSDYIDDRLNAINKLLYLIRQAREVGVDKITVPFVDSSSLKTDKQIRLAVDSLHSVLPLAVKEKVLLCLESDLSPDGFSDLLETLDHPNIRVTYDIGNSASLGYDPDLEMRLYGKRISVVHVKDRTKKGPSVELGKGNADFERVLKSLRLLEFEGPFILQTCRPEKSTLKDELKAVKKQFATFKSYMEKWY